eukprot:9797208-Lingulodinium_polyedra.AAC.1
MVLDFSTFLYEVLGAPDKACFMARLALGRAAEAVGDGDCQDVLPALQLLEDYLSRWTQAATEYGDVSDSGSGDDRHGSDPWDRGCVPGPCGAALRHPARWKP